METAMLEPITDDEIPAVVSLMNRAYRGGAQVGWKSETSFIVGDRTNEELVRADLRAKPAAAFYKWRAASDQALAGCVWLEPLGHDVWYLGSLAAEPAQQNAGLGGTILAAAEERVRACGGTRLRITVVNVRDTLIAWYVRRGYRVTGKTEPFPYGDTRFGTPLRDDLYFVVLEKPLELPAAVERQPP